MNKEQNREQSNRTLVTNAIGAFVNNHPFITMWIIRDVVSIVKHVAHEIGKSSRYRAYNKGYAVFANRLGDLENLKQPIVPWEFEAEKKEEEKKEEETENEEETDDSADDIDSELDDELNDIFSDDSRSGDGDPDNDLHG